MTYEKTGNKVNKDTARNADEYTIKSISTKTILATLIKRHKFGLSVALNIVFVVYFFMPFLPGEIVDILSRL